jgi:very-short-patch-repair endonuclease
LTATNGILDEIRTTVNEGATLSDVDSTDDRLVLTLDGGDESHRYRLDAEATRSLLDAGILSRLTASPKTTKLLV